MTSGGRPLRFLAIVTIGWVGARGVMLWPGGSPITTAGRAAVVRASTPERAATAALRPTAISRPRRAIPTPPLPTPLRRFALITRPAPTTTDRWPDVTAIRAVADRSPDIVPGIVPGLPMPLPAPGIRRARLFGSAWLFVRQGSGIAPGLSGVQLGGSQAGVRIAYALREDHRLALVARLSSPLGRGLRELALGVEWQPTRLPVRIVAEQRVALGAGRDGGGPALGLVGGAGPMPLGAGFDLAAYGQAGVIGRRGGETFADGAVRAAQPIATLGGVRIDLGAGGWGAAQRGAARLDIGPSLSARIPLDRQIVRLSLDWRQRITGNARPNSGIVLSLGADF